MRKIFEKLNAHPERIELAFDGQLKDVEQKAQAIFNDGRRDALQEVFNGAGKMEDAQKKLRKLQKDVESEYARALRLAKEIGVDLDSTQVGKNFKEAFNDIDDYIISADDRITKLKKINL